MPNDIEVGLIPDVSMGCSVGLSDCPLGNPIVNVDPPDQRSDIGFLPSIVEGSSSSPMLYFAGPPEFVGVFPMNHGLQVLPTPPENRDPRVTPYDEPLPFNASELDPDYIIARPGQVLVASDGGSSEWGPIPESLQLDSNGGMLHINQGSGLTDGGIIFNLQGGLEVIRIEANGDFYVHGNKVDNDHEIYQHFRKFLGMSFSLPVPDPRPRDGIETRYERILKKIERDQ